MVCFSKSRQHLIKVLNEKIADYRFTQVTYEKISPSRSIDATNIEFVLEKYEGPNVYMIQDTVLEVRMRIFDLATKEVPATADFVAPRNNVIHTLFDKVIMYLNGCLISSSPCHYPYKAYVINTLTFSDIAKRTHLSCQGYYEDDNGQFDSTGMNENNGMIWAQ